MLPEDKKQQTASTFLNTQYFLVLELPFDLLLVYHKGFSHLEDAEQHLTNELPVFKIWEQDDLSSWSKKTVYIPLKRPKTAGSYTITVETTLNIDANTPDEAHSHVRQTLAPLGFKDTKTVITRAQKVLGDIKNAAISNKRKR